MHRWMREQSQRRKMENREGVEQTKKRMKLYIVLRNLRSGSPDRVSIKPPRASDCVSLELLIQGGSASN